MRELYVYYRLNAPDLSSGLALVRAFQAQLLQSHPRLIARVLHRAEDPGGAPTLMETYATDPALEPAGVCEALQQEIEARAQVLAPLLGSPRHTEVFVALGP